MQYVWYVCVQEGEVVSIQISQGVGYLVSMEQGQIFSYRIRENQGPNYVDCVGYTFVDSFIYLKHVWECLKDCQMVKKGLLGKIPILVNWVNFEAICFAVSIRCVCAIQYARTIDHTRQMFSNGLFVSDNFDGLYVSDLYRGGYYVRLEQRGTYCPIGYLN